MRSDSTPSLVHRVKIHSCDYWVYGSDTPEWLNLFYQHWSALFELTNDAKYFPLFVEEWIYGKWLVQAYTRTCTMKSHCTVNFSCVRMSVLHMLPNRCLYSTVLSVLLCSVQAYIYTWLHMEAYAKQRLKCNWILLQCGAHSGSLSQISTIVIRYQSLNLSTLNKNPTESFLTSYTQQLGKQNCLHSHMIPASSAWEQSWTPSP